MSFSDVLFSPHVWPFTLALGLFFALALMEILFVATGWGANFGLEVDVDLPDISSGWRFLDWLGVGRVPFLISLSAFLLSFGLLGLLVQDVQLELIGRALPWPLVSVGCVVVSLPLVRLINRGLGRIWPRDESSAVSLDSLIGHEAVVVLGTASSDTPAQIKVRDQHGAVHYALAQADVPEESYTTGTPLLIVGRRGPTYTVIRHPNPQLTSHPPGAA